MPTKSLLIIALAFASLLGFGFWYFFTPTPLRWFVCYNTQLSAKDFEEIDWAIVEQDSNPKLWKNDHTHFLAYLSLGEANLTRPYLKDAGRAPYLIQANPDWPNAHWVDVRHPEWQKLIFQTLLPLIAEKGFDGVFLDTLDVPIELERRDPKLYAGSKSALVSIIKEIKTRHPKWLIVSNNALPLLPEMSDSLSAALAEDVYTRFDFGQNKATTTPTDESRQKVKALQTFTQKTGKPALSILYTDNLDAAVLKGATTQATQDGIHWYAAKNDLMTIGMREVQ